MLNKTLFIKVFITFVSKQNQQKLLKMAYYHNDKRAKLISIFEDTLDCFNEYEDLYNCIEDSKHETELIKTDEYYDLGKPDREGKVIVTQSRTFEAAVKYAEKEANSDKIIAVLNFASATNPGGGVTNGAGAQEECLCRCSTLYPVLNDTKLRMEFYEPNRRARNPLHTDDIIYSPGIVIIKSDEEFPERLEPDEWYQVDVITCAAPNLRQKPSNRYNQGDGDKSIKISKDELYELHLSRAQHILNVAAGQNVDILILGAFGCGAFMNDPNVVAHAYADALKEYAGYFDIIEFAVYTSAFDTKNYKAFCNVFEE